jgi:hypothetical protein
MWSKGTLGSTWTTNDYTRDEEECNSSRGGGASSTSEDDEITDGTSTRIEGEDGTIPEKATIHAPEKSCEMSTDGTWICHPYKIELLEQQLFHNSPGSTRRNAVIETLRQVGVKVFVIDSKSTENTGDVVAHIRRVVGFVARENLVVPQTGPLGFQRCLLYQDEQGRLFNLMVSKHAVGPVATWLEQLDSFSGCEAMIAIAVLCRSLPCIANSKKKNLLV